MDDESIKYNPLPEDPVPIGPKKDRPRRARKDRAKSEEIISMSEQENFVEIALETIEKAKQQQEAGEDKSRIIDVFTHSKTGFPGAWPEEEVSKMLDAWEQAMDALRASDKPFNVCNMVMDILKKNGFREVRKFEVLDLMQKLRKEYETFCGLQDLQLETKKADCVPQMMRIFRKRPNRRYRRRRTSTASNMDIGVLEDGQNEMVIKQEQEDDGQNRMRRVRLPRQNLQRSMRVMIGQQKAVLDYLQSVSKTIEDSNGKVVRLLEQLVSLQRN